MVESASALLVLLALIAAAAPPNGVGPPPAKVVAAQPLTVSAMTFNIRFGTAADGPDHWLHRGEFCIDVIDRHGGDFVGLQEALRFQIDAIRAKLSRYHETGVGREDGKEGGEHCTILYDARRWRLDADRHGTFWLSETPDVPGSRSWGNRITRIVTWGRFVELPDGPVEPADAPQPGRAVWVFNTHFDHESQPSRERSAALLLSRIAELRGNLGGEPLILLGDLNAGEDNAVVRFISGQGELDGAAAAMPLVDTFRAVHPDAEEVGTYTAFEFGRTGGSKIDYVFADRRSLVHAAAIIREHREERYPSDHFPVSATVSWGGNTAE
jgi:endonuclease/exonuclease/phosphatase family metal-dependent hydrolase